MIKNILFDLGNVLLDQKTIDVSVYLSNLFNIPFNDSNIFYKKYEIDVEKGNISFEKLISLYKNKFNNKKPSNLLIDEYQKLYIKDIYGINYYLINFIKKASKKYSIYIMTNILSPHYNHWKEFNRDKYFKRIFRSYVDHFYKPEKKAYIFVLNELNSKPGECVLIDDLKANVQGAVSAGLEGIVYKNNDQLFIDLEKIGVKI